MILQIDPEFKKLITPLQHEEYEGLEKNIIANGCLDSIKIWLDNIIIDGHNRYEICQKHDIPFETKIMEFPSRNDVKVWIIRNQFDRRNISAWQRGQMALELKEIISEKAKENQKTSTGGSNPQLLQNSAEGEAPINTREELAKKAGVSHDTIARIEKIKSEGTPEQIERLDSKEASINEVYNEIKNGNLCARAIELIRGSPIEGRKPWLMVIAKIKDEQQQVSWIQMILANPEWSFWAVQKKIMAEEYGFTLNDQNRIILPKSTLHTYNNGLPKEKQKEIIKDVLEGKYPPFTEMEVCLVNQVQDELVYEVKIEMGLIKPPKEKPSEEEYQLDKTAMRKFGRESLEDKPKAADSAKIAKLERGIQDLQHGLDTVYPDLSEYEIKQLEDIISGLSYKANHYDKVEVYEESREA
jgi:transcriptional regulator with XRE-family HTH domain